MEKRKERPKKNTPLCGADTSAKTGIPGSTCRKTAGWGTDHKGQGVCRLHGGSTPIKHGLRSRYAAITRPRIRALLESFEGDTEPENLLPEVHLLRALILDFVERYDTQTEALLAWHASFNPQFDVEFARWLAMYRHWDEGYLTWKAQWKAYQETVERVQHHYKGGWPEPPPIQVYDEPPPPPEPLHFQNKPRDVPDILSVGKFIATIGALVERVYKARQEGSITMATLDAVIERYGEEATYAVRDVVEDNDLRTAIFNAIEGRWRGIPRPTNR